jgi:hypothetical protein
MTLFKKIILYQTRFPIIIVLLPIIFSIFILKKFANFNFEISNLLCILTLWSYYTIRVVDEQKDYNYDLKYHPHRPIASGRISILDLWISNIFLIFCIFLYVYFLDFFRYIYFVGFYLLSFISFTFLSKKNFGIVSLHDNFLAYNFINSLGNAYILILTYIGAILYAKNTLNFQILIFHFLLCFGGSLLLEITRKIDSSGPDTYLHNISWRQYLTIFLSIILAMNIGALGFIYLVKWKIGLLFIFNILLLLILNSKNLKNLKIVPYFWYLFLLLICFIF